MIWCNTAYNIGSLHLSLLKVHSYIYHVNKPDEMSHEQKVLTRLILKAINTSSSVWCNTYKYYNQNFLWLECYFSYSEQLITFFCNNNVIFLFLLNHTLKNTRFIMPNTANKTEYKKLFPVSWFLTVKHLKADNTIPYLFITNQQKQI
jgi:hypothetical protein